MRIPIFHTYTTPPLSSAQPPSYPHPPLQIALSPTRLIFHPAPHTPNRTSIASSAPPSNRSAPNAPPLIDSPLPSLQPRQLHSSHPPTLALSIASILICRPPHSCFSLPKFSLLSLHRSNQPPTALSIASIRICQPPTPCFLVTKFSLLCLSPIDSDLPDTNFLFLSYRIFVALNLPLHPSAYCQRLLLAIADMPVPSLMPTPTSPASTAGRYSASSPKKRLQSTPSLSSSSARSASGSRYPKRAHLKKSSPPTPAPTQATPSPSSLCPRKDASLSDCSSSSASQSSVTSMSVSSSDSSVASSTQSTKKPA
eukprot:jgi/Psemu1/55709/gm1.55709_g